MDVAIATAVGGIGIGSLYAIMALGLVALFKTLGLANFAQGEMAMFFGLRGFHRLLDRCALVSTWGLSGARFRCRDWVRKRTAHCAPSSQSRPYLHPHCDLGAEYLPEFHSDDHLGQERTVCVPTSVRERRDKHLLHKSQRQHSAHCWNSVFGNRFVRSVVSRHCSWPRHESR